MFGLVSEPAVATVFDDADPSIVACGRTPENSDTVTNRLELAATPVVVTVTEVTAAALTQ